MRYRLVDQTANGGNIKTGRRYVGSVRRAEDGVRWVGRIGPHTATSMSAIFAFREVAARAMGFASLAALRAQNAQVRRNNRARRAENYARHIVGRRVFPIAAGPVEDEPYEQQ